MASICGGLKKRGPPHMMPYNLCIFFTTSSMLLSSPSCTTKYFSAKCRKNPDDWRVTAALKATPFRSAHPSFLRLLSLIFGNGIFPICCRYHANRSTLMRSSRTGMLLPTDGNLMRWHNNDPNTIDATPLQSSRCMQSRKKKHLQKNRHDASGCSGSLNLHA